MRIGYWNLGTVATPSIVVVAVMVVVNLFTISIRRPKLAGGFAARVGLAYIVKPTVAFTARLCFRWYKINFPAIVAAYSLIRLNRHKRNANQDGADDEGGDGVRQRREQADAMFRILRFAFGSGLCLLFH